jgi:RNA polymerase sigma-70 factor, ECF subfamily
VLRADLLRYDRRVSAPVERESVEALWEASSRRLRAWFERRTGSAHDADDLVQETFLRVQARLASLRDGERLDAWVGAIAANVLADHHRRRAHGAQPLEDACSASSEPAAPQEDDVDLRLAVAGWLDAFLAGLEPRDAAILRAVDLEGRAQVDVAAELGLAPSSARSRVQRARARLRAQLEDCCSFAFDARGSVTEARRRPGSSCGCDGPVAGCGS